MKLIVGCAEEPTQECVSGMMSMVVVRRVCVRVLSEIHPSGSDITGLSNRPRGGSSDSGTATRTNPKITGV